MNANARAFVPQNMTTKTNTTSSPSISRAQRSSGRNFVLNQSSLQPDVRRNSFKNQNYHAQGDQNARLSVNNNRKNNSRHKQNRHSYHHRNQLDDVKNGDRGKGSSSINENDVNQDQDSNYFVDTVDTVETNLNDLILNDQSSMTYGAPNRRGQISLNHLLNFSFPPRQSSQANVPRRQKTTNYQPYNKERFLNANFRFLVRSMGDYTAYQVDPDILLNWEDIEQVIITSPNTPSCPICLQQPTAARVTRCGHTYCLACILHYLQLNDENEKPNKKWRKCPICWDYVYAKDLKNVRFWAVRTIKKVGNGGLLEGEERLTMRLIQRPMNSTIALPRSPTWPLHDSTNNVPWHFTPNALTFSKLMLASFDYLQSEYNRDIKDLKDALQEACDWNSNDEIPFIEMAIVNIKEHLESLEMLSTKASLESERRAHEVLEMAELEYERTHDKMNSLNSFDSIEPASTDNKDNKNDTSHNDIDDVTFSSTSPPSFLPDDFKDQPHIANISPLKPEEKHKIKTTKDLVADDKMYYYYQSEDGQHIYLNPLDIRVLKQEFKSYDNFPDEITVRIVGVDESTMTEDLRKRFKYLSHLPLSCDITFLEVDLKGYVSDNSLKVFENELKQRYNRRKEKARKEERLHEQAVNKERRSKDIQQETLSSDPFFQPYSYSSEANNNATIIPESSDTTENAHNNDNGKNNDQYDGPRTVWGTPAVSFTNVTNTKGKDSNEHDNEDLWNLPEEEIYVGKKQKKKKLVLMSTGGKRQR